MATRRILTFLHRRTWRRRDNGAPVSSPLERTAELDGLVVDPTSDEVALVMVETRAWDGGPDQLRQLREKTSAYLGMVVDGALIRDHPEAEGRRIRIELDCRGGAPGAAAEPTLRNLADVVGRYGVRLVVVGGGTAGG